MNKVQKICEEIAKKLDVMQYQVHRKDAYKELKSILDYIYSLQEESVSKEIGDYDHKAVMEALHPELKEEPVSEELLDTTQTITYNGEVYTRCYKDKLDAFACKYPTSVPKPSKRYAKYSDVDLTIAVKEGAKWQKEHLWKPADGDDLPEIDREVIVLCKNGRVAFGHRPFEKFKARFIGYGRTEEYEVKTYGKNGWNIPDVKYWLDVKLPKEIEEL